MTISLRSWMLLCPICREVKRSVNNYVHHQMVETSRRWYAPLAALMRQREGSTEKKAPLHRPWAAVVQAVDVSIPLRYPSPRFHPCEALSPTVGSWAATVGMAGGR